jgi:hypothetical protein
MFVYYLDGSNFLKMIYTQFMCLLLDPRYKGSIPEELYKIQSSTCEAVLNVLQLCSITQIIFYITCKI